MLPRQKRAVCQSGDAHGEVVTAGSKVHMAVVRVATDIDPGMEA